ncbi:MULTISPECIES: acyl-CoA thioesterase II [unclassified Pseudomonas]|uniref:acyl-CoA thioesterase n=1 Tax=unclassified Pseudomonas TaxID=196821 RepID=UPI000BD1A73E|nr:MULTISPECIES: thioesterase family protein [unclassified Pseudomonas]PVZ20148.1 acyl-CoA thioesterase [Pseudomonas sp. URIL14HWK12:I12]PVZ27214.1 acyl-CoA thioesterase [Pseudomonas sp. URIL14HWK12:I10]PVZ38103.1 acyl-CoA thioesterase [Pseudomonas sp. URIL14HWK12:I11]SNZ04551.1 Acyl-CoA thioesterase [Pseudomonas sp. URIL14HWK12:I9]
MTLHELFDAARQPPHTLSVPSHWSQGRAAYGGLMAALLYEAMGCHAPVDAPLRSLTVTFVGPAQVGAPIHFEPQVLRRGKSVTSLLCIARQNGEIVTTAQACFGAPRASAIAVTARPAPGLPARDRCAQVRAQGGWPAYLEHLEMYWGLGGMPFSGTPSPAIGGWMRLPETESDQPLDVARLIVLADAWPPAVLPHLNGPAPASTLSWTLECRQPLPAIGAGQWLQYEAVVEHAADGYGHAAAALWTETGELVALSRQTVTVFG